MAKSFFSSFSDFSSPSVMPIPLLKMQTSLFDNAAAMTSTSSNVYTTSLVTTRPTVSAKPCVSPKPISDSCVPSRKR